MSVRRYQSADRAVVASLLGREQGIDDSNSRIHVSADGRGVALWTKPTDGMAYLGPVVTIPPNRQLFYELIRACAADMIGEGFERGYFAVKNETLRRLIERDFSVTAEVYGRDGKTQQPTSWRIEVDLADAVRQLDARLA